jgi:hypothetical protein
VPTDSATQFDCPVGQRAATAKSAGATPYERPEMIGTQKPVTMNMLENVPVAFGQTERGEDRRTNGQAGGLGGCHCRRATLPKGLWWRRRSLEKNHSEEFRRKLIRAKPLFSLHVLEDDCTIGS